MKKVFYEGPLDEYICLDEAMTHHLLHVLRFNIQQNLLIANKEGLQGFYRYDKEEDKCSYWTLVSDLEKQAKKSPIVLIQAFLKGEKLEWVLQKVCELDVSACILLNSKNTVAKYDQKKLPQKMTRWQKILKEASQQSNRSYLPQLEVCNTYEALDHYLAEKFPNIGRIVAYEREESHTLKDWCRDHNWQEGAALCIGPEGGFDEEEINRLSAMGFASVTLGDTILRAETAAIVGTGILSYERG